MINLHEKLTLLNFRINMRKRSILRILLKLARKLPDQGTANMMGRTPQRIWIERRLLNAGENYFDFKLVRSQKNYFPK